MDRIELREDRKLAKETNERLVHVSEVIANMKAQPSITETEFLKEDFMTSPRY